MSTDVPGNAQPIKPALTLKDTASPMKSNCLDERVTGRDFLTEESERGLSLSADPMGES